MAVVSKARKIKMGKVLVENVLAMHREEIFGIKNCKGLTWDIIFKDYLIMCTLKHSNCSLNDEQVDCLYNKI